MVKIKICGICHGSEIGIMNELSPDFVGFVFITKSRHFIAPEVAGVLQEKEVINSDEIKEIVERNKVENTKPN